MIARCTNLLQPIESGTTVIERQRHVLELTGAKLNEVVLQRSIRFN